MTAPLVCTTGPDYPMDGPIIDGIQDDDPKVMVGAIQIVRNTHRALVNRGEAEPLPDKPRPEKLAFNRRSANDIVREASEREAGQVKR